MRPRPAAALASPAFLGALALLLLNDHLFKGAGLLPSALTGKLSDLAGLVVAPVLAAALLGARAPRGRALAFALAVVPFVAINLSPAAARALEAVMGGVGIPWRVWTDPTDLVALAVLPFAWQLAGARPGGLERAATERAAARHRLVERTALVCAAFACVATSNDPPPADPTIRTFYTTDAFVWNETDEALTVRVRWLDAQVDCAAIRTEPGRALGREAFGRGVSFEVAPADLVPLSRSAAAESLGLLPEDLGAPATSGCEAVLLQADGLEDQVVLWSRDAVPVREVTREEASRDTQGALAVSRDAEGRLSARAGTGLVAEAQLQVVDPPLCDAGVPIALEWSEVDPARFGRHTVVAVDPGADGCLAVDLRDERAGDDWRTFLCLPAWAFPFAPGEGIDVYVEAAWGERTLIVSNSGEGGVLRELYVGHDVTGDAARGGGAPLRFETVELDCEGARTGCGAYGRPHGVALAGAREVLVPGEDAVLDPGSTGRPGRFLLGRAYRASSVPSACAQPADLQLHYDALVLFEEVP